MATQFTFNNQIVKLPGSYSTFKSGVTNPALSLPFGNVLLIDTGSGVGYGGGAGIVGTLASGADAIYEVETLEEFRDAVGGGILWDIAEKLFQPNGPGGGNGVSKLFYARAATTEAAEVTLDFTAGVNGGTSIIQAKNEGTVGNGVEGDQTLSNTLTTPYTVTAVGAATNVHTLKVTDPADGLITLGSYTVVGTPSLSDVATALASSVNAGSTGYTAVASGATVIVTSRNPRGLENATDFDSIATSYVVTGSATGTAGTFAGGVDGTLLTRGYSTTMSAGVNDPNLFIVKFWRGTYKGKDENGYVWDEVQETSTAPTLVITSPEFDDINDFHTWMETDTKFGSLFKLKTKTVVGTGIIVTADLTANSGNNLFAGGTTVYNTARVDDVLEHVQSVDYSLVLADKYEDNAQHTDNGKILAHLTESDTFGDKLMFVGGGADSNKFELGTTYSSQDTAVYYNNDRVIICHGGPIKNTPLVAQGFITETSLHKAASVCGRVAGLEPQIPITFKTIKIDGERHKLSLKEQKRGLDRGVLMTAADKTLFRVIQGVNSIQDNKFLINPNATTHSIQLRRMMAQINREIVVNATEQLLKNPNGTNRNTLAPSDLKSFVETYLRGRSVTKTSDNIVIDFRNVNVVLDNDAYKCTYDIIFNTEITKLFFTGTVYLSF